MWREGTYSADECQGQTSTNKSNLTHSNSERLAKRSTMCLAGPSHIRTFLSPQDNHSTHGSQQGHQGCCLSFPVAVIKHPGKTSLRGRAYSASLFQDKSRQQEREAANHIATTVRKQRVTNAGAHLILCFVYSAG